MGVGRLVRVVCGEGDGELEAEREGDASGDRSMRMTVSLGWSGLCSPGDLCAIVRLRERCEREEVSEPIRQPSLAPLLLELLALLLKLQALLLEVLALLLEMLALLIELLAAQFAELLSGLLRCCCPVAVLAAAIPHQRHQHHQH